MAILDDIAQSEAKRQLHYGSLLKEPSKASQWAANYQKEVLIASAGGGLSLRALSKPDHLLNPYKPNELGMIYQLWKARGLMGDFKTPEALFKKVKNVMNSKTGPDSLGKALDHIFGKGNYEGLPLGYNKSGSSRKGDRVVTEVFFDKRKVQQTIPLSIRDRVARMEKDGTFERAGIKPGILDRIEARNKKGLTRLQKETRRLEKLYGIKFEMGHLTAIANLGTDNPLNLFPELKSENRSHGAREDPLNPQTQMELGWGGGHEQDLYEMILEEGGNPAVLGVSGKDWTSADQGKMARMGADPNQVGFSRSNAILDRTLQKFEQDLAKANKDGNLLQFVDNINARITDQGYQSLAPTLKQQPKGEVMKIIAKPSPKEINRYKSVGYEWNSQTGDFELPNKPAPGEEFNRNINALSDYSKGLARTAIEKSGPVGLGLSLGQQAGSCDIGGVINSLLGAEINTIEQLPNLKQLPK